MTENQPQSPQQPGWGQPGFEAPQAATKKPLYKKKRVLIPAGLFVLMVAATAGSGSSDTTNATPAANDAAVAEAPAAVEEAPAAVEEAPAEAVVEAPPVVEEPPAPAEPAETSGQKNAKKAAQNYLSMTGFSRQGLIDQLSSEYGDQYSVEDATYGVDAQNADWNEQAYRSAKNYLDMTAFSRQGLIDQLSSDYGDKYTVEQATYGADKALAE